MDDSACRQWALALVRAKLQRQLRTLRVCESARPDARKALQRASHAAGDPAQLLVGHPFSTQGTIKTEAGSAHIPRALQANLIQKM